MMRVTIKLDLNKEDAEQVYKLYQQVWWANQRSLESTRNVLEGSTHSVGIYDLNKELIGFGRALSDGVEKATLYDIIIDESYKGQGFGKMIVEKLLDAPKCKKANHVELYCKEEMIPFYHKLGFSDITSQVKLLRQKPSVVE